jgi:hypothetical protein
MRSGEAWTAEAFRCVKALRFLLHIPIFSAPFKFFTVRFLELNRVSLPLIIIALGSGDDSKTRSMKGAVSPETATRWTAGGN